MEKQVYIGKPVTTQDGCIQWWEDVPQHVEDYFASGAAREDREATMTRCIDCGGEIIEGEDHRCHTFPPIVFPVAMLDPLSHTEENGYECGEAGCPCHEPEWSDPDDTFINPVDLVARTGALLDAIYGKEA